MKVPHIFDFVEINPVILAAEHPENNWLPAVVFGGGLVVLGIGMMIGHSRSWKRQQADASVDDLDRIHYANRFRRRMQTSALIAIVGALLAVGDIFIWRFGPAVSTVFWLLILLLVCWVALLGVGDMTAIQSHSRNRLADLEAQRHVLEQELEAIRARSGARPVNGERHRQSGDDSS
ncbi:hypothetical protein GC176_00340 [bacterium]|nr:hypothetical protein [bacterium]